MLRRLWAVVFVLVLVASACTQQDVADLTTKLGLTLTSSQTEAASAFLTAQDCLPNYNADRYVECAIRDAAARYGLDVDRLARIAWCESGFDPGVKNRRSSALGLFQFLTSTWVWVRDLGAPYAHLDRTNARANAFTAAWLMARSALGGVGHWNASRRCWG